MACKAFAKFKISMRLMIKLSRAVAHPAVMTVASLLEIADDSGRPIL